MATYYVRKTGDDTTGNGSTGTPWLTISKALGTIATQADHTLLIGDGVYSESTSGLNYLLCQRTQTVGKYLTIQAELGAAGDVTLQGTTSVNYSTRLDGSRYLKFYYIKFAAAVNVGYGSLMFSGTYADHFEFHYCTIVCRGAVAASYGVFIEASGTQNYNNILFNTCTFNEVGVQTNGVGVRMGRSVAGATVDTITFSNCTFNMPGICVWLYGLTNILVDGGSYTSSIAFAMEVGVDGSTGLETTGTIQNATFATTTDGSASHCVLIGAGCSGVSFLNNSVNAACLSGVVLKECTGTVVRGNKITGGDVLNSLYCKAAVNPVITYNTIYHNEGVLFKVGINSTTTNKCQNVTFTNNRLFGTGTSSLFSWGGDTEDAGGGVCDYNIYSSKGSGKFGAVRANSNVLTLAALQAAWSGYNVLNNDTHSRNFHAAVVMRRGLKRRTM